MTGGEINLRDIEAPSVERAPVRSDELFAGKNQFNIQEVSTPADLNTAETTLLLHESKPRATDDEVIVGFAPPVPVEHQPIVLTRKGRVAAGLATILATTSVMLGAGVTPTRDADDKVNFQNSINKRAKTNELVIEHFKDNNSPYRNSGLMKPVSPDK